MMKLGTVISAKVENGELIATFRIDDDSPVKRRIIEWLYEKPFTRVRLSESEGLVIEG